MTDIAWAHAGPSILTAFLASFVEFVEALTVILAIGSVRGWRDATLGAATAVLVLLALVAVLGSAMTHIPLHLIQVFVGALLMLFGLRWLRKAVLRSAGVIPLHDEAAAFDRQIEIMKTQDRRIQGWDPIAFAGAFQITMLEGTEVVFIIIAIGAGGGGRVLPASFGAAAALVAVAILGVVVHRPLATVPENRIKFIVGVLLSAFGSFWFGEGIGIAWPGADWSILPLLLGFLGAALLATPICRMRMSDQPTPMSR